LFKMFSSAFPDQVVSPLSTLCVVTQVVALKFVKRNWQIKFKFSFQATLPRAFFFVQTRLDNTAIQILYTFVAVVIKHSRLRKKLLEQS